MSEVKPRTFQQWAEGYAYDDRLADRARAIQNDPTPNRHADIQQARCPHCGVLLGGQIGDHSVACPWVSEQARMAQNAYADFKLTAGFGDWPEQPKLSTWQRLRKWLWL